jgi:ParB/RepB/Spo0J family partition protein
MREFRHLAIDTIHESPTNPRRQFSEVSLGELAASIRRRGVLQPILVRPNEEGFVLIAGARRLKASVLAGCTTIPARVLDLDDSAADEATIIENLHREDISPLEEGESYQRLVDGGRTIDELSAQLGKTKAYLYQRLSLTRLIPKAKELVAQDILPIHYALKLATVPADRQADGLEKCFRPLFRDEPSRDQLEPLSELTEWIERTVRLDPHAEATSVLLPELAEQVASVEQERDASILALSTLVFHTDRRDPKPILAKSWKPAEGKERCKYARPGVIVLGEGQGSFVQACIEKKKCKKHWPELSAEHRAKRVEVNAEVDAERRRQEAAWAKQREQADRWRNQLRPQALRLIAERTGSLKWSRPILTLLLSELGATDVAKLIGKLDRLPTKRYPQALCLALASRRSWDRDNFMRFAKQLGLKLTAKQLEDAAKAATPSVPEEDEESAGPESDEDAES